MRTLLLSAALSLLVATPAAAEEVVPLDLSRPHVLLIGGVPDLRIYERPGLTGQPALKLDARGLHAHGRLVCIWPGGEVDELNDPTVVLEAVNAPGQPCTGYPIVSTWTADGDGPAALYVEVVRWSGTLLEVELEGKTHYLDWSSIPAQSWYWLNPEDLARQDREWEQEGAAPASDDDGC